MRAVERRQRDQVENRKVDVVDDDELQDLVHADGRTPRDMMIREEHDERQECRHEVCGGPGQRNEDIVAARILEVAGVDDDRLRPAEAHEKQHDEADGVDMCDRIERQAAHHARRRIAEGVGRARMRIFMDDHRDDEARDACDDIQQIQIKHRFPQYPLSFYCIIPAGQGLRPSAAG